MEVRLVLGDQLNTQHSWFKTTDNQVTYVLMEMRQETDYVVHHIQKVVAFFGAMRQFGQTLVQQGHRVHYLKIEDPENRQDLSRNLQYILDTLKNPILCLSSAR